MFIKYLLILRSAYLLSNRKKTANKYCAESDACAKGSWCSVSFLCDGTTMDASAPKAHNLHTVSISSPSKGGGCGWSIHRGKKVKKMKTQNVLEGRRRIICSDCSSAKCGLASS